MRLAVQTYTIRHEMKDDIHAALFKLKSLGVEAIELARVPFNYAIAQVVKETGLRVESIQVKFHLLKRHFAHFVRFCKEVDCAIVVVSVLPIPAILGGSKAIARFARQLDELAKRYEEEGISLAFHHHAFEFQTIRGKTQIYVIDGSHEFIREVRLGHLLDKKIRRRSRGVHPVDRRSPDRSAFARFEEIRTTYLRYPSAATASSIFRRCFKPCRKAFATAPLNKTPFIPTTASPKASNTFNHSFPLEEPMEASKMKRHEPYLFAWGDVFGGGAQALIGVIYLIYLTDVIGISPALAGAAILISKVWDAVTDPVMGVISDNTRTKIGRRRPFILAGGAVLIGFVRLALVPDRRLGQRRESGVRDRDVRSSTAPSRRSSAFRIVRCRRS
ncbi:MAG: MFS transporter [Bacillus subtilis]|nr:MFS transporter [Bacillus subtilis]